MWGCGLKYMKHMLMPTASTVTPYVGVWIEIKEKSKKKNNFWSPPMWGCGLKFDIVDSIFGTIESPPMWGCGLKFELYRQLENFILSPPMWGCGLKYYALRKL